MAYTPTEWTDGDALAAAKFNKMENGLRAADSSYVPTEWTPGDVITAEALNKIENGIADAAEASVTVESLSVNSNGTYTAPPGKAYSPVAVSVPNSYAAADEGKVVSNGALVAQTSDTVTENGTVDTTLINSLEVNVSGGGGNPVAEEKDVNFIDYDGTIRYSYTAEEFAALDALPANPDHTDEGLIAQGWNWTLADAKAYVAECGALFIGQSYDTASEATEIDIELFDGRLNPALGLAINGTAYIDWGDGSAVETATGSSYSTVIYTPHTYAKAGKYTIKVKAEREGYTWGATISSVSSGSSSASALIVSGTGNTNAAEYYRNAVTGLRLSAKSKIDINDGWGNSLSLKMLTIPIGMRFGMGKYGFRSGKLDGAFVFPSDWDSSVVADEAFKNASVAIVSFTGPGQNGTRMGSIFSGINTPYMCIPLKFTTFSAGSGGIFANASRIARLVIHSGVTSSFSANYFSNMSGLGELRFNRTTVSSSASAAFSNLPADCKILVPFSALAAYLVASNYPAPATYTYLGFATYANGATLPTQDSTEAYNVTWYASKADAIAQTNPITQGNGAEIYCRYVAAA